MSLRVQNYITSLKNAIYSSKSDLATSGPQPSFHSFSLLPAELKRKVWDYALPNRIIEARLCNQVGAWHYFSQTPSKILDARKMPALFSANVESRQFCLEQYVLFSNNYIHPRLDILFISWHQDRSHVKCKKIEGRPLDNFEKVIFTAGPNRKYKPTRFGHMMECIKDLGSPSSISLGFDGPKLPQMLSDLRGYSIATGHQVIMLNWVTDLILHEDPTPQKSMQEEVTDAFRIEEQAVPGLKLPAIKERLAYVFSGP